MKTSLNVISIFRQLGSTGNRPIVALQTGNSGISRRTMTGLLSGLCWKSGMKTENLRKYLWWSLFLTILFLGERRKIRRLLALLLKTMSGIYIFTWLCKHLHSFRPKLCKVCLKKISHDEYFRICSDCTNHICEDCSSYSKQDNDSLHLPQVLYWEFNKNAPFTQLSAVDLQHLH